MEEDKFNNIQIYPTPTPSTQPNTPVNSNNNFQDNSFDNQTVNTQPTTALNTQSEPPLPTATISSSSFSSSNTSATSSGKFKKIIIPIALVAIVAATITTLFLTGIIGEHRIEVGDYTVVIDENNWTASIGQDGNTLVLMNKNNSPSGIGILPYVNDITYDLLDQGDRMKSFINQIDNVQFESQTKQTISHSRCIVVNIKYKKVNYANDKAIKAFCEGKDGTIFLIEVEGANQTELNSNLSTGVDIINTAKHK